MSPRVETYPAPQTLTSRLTDEESGQDLIEYALIAAFAGFVAISGIRSLALNISNSVDTISSEVALVLTPAPPTAPPSTPAATPPVTSPTPATTPATPTSPTSTPTHQDHGDRH